MAILINDNSARVQYTATTNQTVFTVPFEFFANSDLKVYNGSTLLTFASSPANASQYNVSGAGVTGGGSIALGSPGAALGNIITIVRGVPIERTSDFPLSGPFNIEALNTTLDKMTVMLQDVDTKFEQRVPRLAENDTPNTLAAIPSIDQRKGKLFYWDENGQPSAIDTSGIASVVAYGNVIVNTFTGNGSTTAFTLTEDPSSVNNLIVTINGVTQTPATDYSFLGLTLNFTSAPPIDSEILVRFARALPDNTTTAGFVTYDPGATYTTGSIGKFLDPFFGVADAVFEVSSEAGAGLQRGISVEHYADTNGSYGIDIHQYQGAKSAFVVHCYSDENGAVAGSVAAQIDHTRSGSILTLKNARNAVTSPGTTGTASFLQMIGYPDTSVSLATPPVTLAQWNYQNVLLCPEASWPFTITGYGTVINSFSGGTGLTVNHLTPGTYGLTINGKQYGGVITADTDNGAGLWVAKTSGGAGSGLVIQNEGTGNSIVGISGGSTKYYLTKDGDFYVNGAKVLGARGAVVSNGVYAAGSTPTQAEFNALVDVVNAILARLRAGTPSIAT
jgi:hypothetical protein